MGSTPRPRAKVRSFSASVVAEEFGAGEEGVFQAGDAGEGGAVGQAAAGVDGAVVFLGAPAADGVEVFEGEADGVHDVVATGADGFLAVGGEALADGERGGDDAVEGGTLGGGGGVGSPI